MCLWAGAAHSCILGRCAKNRPRASTGMSLDMRLDMCLRMCMDMVWIRASAWMELEKWQTFIGMCLELYVLFFSRVWCINSM